MIDNNESSNDNNILKQDIEKRLNKVRDLAIESNNLKFLKMVYKVEKKIIKMELKNNLTPLKLNHYNHELIKIELKLHDYNQYGSSKEYAIIAYTVVSAGIATILSKAYIVQAIEHLNDPKYIDDKISLQFSIGLSNLMITLTAGAIGFVTYAYAHLSQNRARSSDKLILAILFPIILLIIFIDVSQSFELSLPSLLCFAVGYNFQILLLFANKILEKVKETIEKI